MTRELTDAVERLGVAFEARDVAAALDCFVDDDDIAYVGSEIGERARGRAAVGQLLAALFARSARYTWNVLELDARCFGPRAFVTAEVLGLETGDDGTLEEFPYRLSGLLEVADDGWRWRVCQGSEPTNPGGDVGAGD